MRRTLQICLGETTLEKFCASHGLPNGVSFLGHIHYKAYTAQGVVTVGTIVADELDAATILSMAPA